MVALRVRQAIRNEDDLECLSVPVKYREMGTFYKVQTASRLALASYRPVPWFSSLARGLPRALRALPDRCQ